jgi:(p)ppGpp synthase/HD superfamily hydrolase
MTSTIQKARRFAVAAHGDQKYNTDPYVAHLDAVVGLLAPYGEKAQVIGYLHDVIEDTAVTRREIAAEFGAFVADCVAIVTDVPGPTRKERKAKTHAKMSNVTGDHELALVVKAADRLANVRASLSKESRAWLAMYRREQPEFRAAAYRPGLCDEIWEQLELALRT